MPQLKFLPGDVLAFWGRDWQSTVIEVVTRGPSHVGIIFEHEGRPLLLESTTLCDAPCVITGKRVRGVQAHDPFVRTATYRGRAYRLPLVAQLCYDESVHLTHIAINEFIGKPYDLEGALQSGPSVLKPAHWLNPDLGSVFCSALVAHLLMRVNRMNWANPKLFNPADVVRTIRRTATHSAPEFLA